MPRAKLKGSDSEVKRRWRIPPPLLRDAESPGPEGLSILSEIQSELGGVLWKTLRSVLLWSQVAPSEQKDLFDAEAGRRRLLEVMSAVPDEAGDLKDALEVLAEVVVSPERADPEAVGVACRMVSGWAEAADAPRTSLEFLQAAALSCPANARFALAIGRTTRDLAQYSRAESWLHRAIGLARQSRDWETYVRAYLGHGKMMLRRGALPAARRSYAKALRRSVRQGLREMEALALQDLFILEDKAGQSEKSLSYARRALEAFGPRHEGLPHLAHDIAVFWMQRGDFEHAFPVLRETVDRVKDSCRGIALGSIARAAGHMSDTDAFDWAQVELDRWWDGPGIADAWAEVARGAMALGRLDQARTAAERAETMARRRGESLVRFEAEALLESIRAEQAALAQQARSGSFVPTTDDADELARDLLRSLQGQPVGV